MKTIFKPLSLQDALPRLVDTYHKGKLVPFTGSGISAPSIPTWKAFVKNLYDLNELNFNEDRPLIQASEDIVTSLSREDNNKYITAIKESLNYKGSSQPTVTDQCKSLSEIWWPLVISTNYDNMFVESYKKCHTETDDTPISIYGRNNLDCHSLLTSLNSPSNTSYWALQGYFGNSINNINLEEEIVVGYRHYRKATYNNSIFRAVFGDLFRRYSLLFLGSGLTEDYFLGLFGEILEKFGSNPHTHCALFNEKDINSIDHHFLATKLNITAIFYKDQEEEEPYNGLRHSIDSLSTEIKKTQHRLEKLNFKNISYSENTNDDSGLEIILGELKAPKEGECNVYSAGFGDNFKPSHVLKNYIKNFYGQYHPDNFKNKSGPVWQYGDKPVFATVARDLEKFTRSSREKRDLRIISPALNETLSQLTEQYSVINTMLFAAGSKRSFPAVFSLIQMLRGYKKFLKTNSERVFKLKIYVIDASVIRFLRNNTLGIEEIINCDDIRINIEIHEPEEIERFQLYLDQDKALNDVSNFYSINPTYWQATIIPKPYPREQFTPTDSSNTLAELGMIPGSTLQYKRKVT